MRPGVNIETLERATPSTIPTDVSVGIMIGITEAGPSIPTSSDTSRNIDEYATVYAPSGQAFMPGQRMLNSADEFFRQGGSALIVGRVTGGASAPATADVLDNASAVVLEVTANGDGEWGNDLDIKVDLTADDPEIPANTYRISVIRSTDDVLLEVSPYLSDTDGAMAWAKADSNLISIEGGTSILLPDSATYSLAGGLNDLAAIDNDDWIDGINSIGRNLGPGVMMLPGITTSTLHQEAARAAEALGRVFLADLPDTEDEATLITAAKSITNADGQRSRYTGAFTPWLIVPGNTAGSVRKVPPSVAVAGRFAANMSLGMSANEPAAADNGILSRVLDFTHVWPDDVRERLNNNGVNVILDSYGTPKIYGWRTTADPVNDKLWIPLSNTFLHRQIVSLANVVQERFVFRQLDGQGKLISSFQAALVGHVCSVLFEQGALFGNVPSEAYNVDVGSNVNTPETIENNELRAVISVRMAPFGEKLTVYIVKYAVSESIPA